MTTRSSLSVLAAVALATGLAAAQPAPPAAAQGFVCAPRELILEELGQRFQERQVALAVTGNGQLLEILVSSGGSWSILVTTPNGPTCLVSSGDGWRSLPSGPLAEAPLS